MAIKNSLYFFSILTICLMNACVSQMSISLDAQKNCHVLTYALDSNDCNTIYTSKEVLDCSFQYERVRFTLSSIDSLGNYIHGVKPGYFKFNLEENLLRITNNKMTDVLIRNDGICCTILFRIQFEKKVKIIQADNIKVKSISNNEIEFYVYRKDIVNENYIFEVILSVDGS